MDQAAPLLSLEHSRPESRELNSDNGGGTKSPHSKNSIKASCGRLATISLTAAKSPPSNSSNSSGKNKNRTYGQVTEDTSHPLPQTTQPMLMVIHSSGPWEMSVAEGALSTWECNSYTYCFTRVSPQRWTPGHAQGVDYDILLVSLWPEWPLRKIATDPVAGTHASSLWALLAWAENVWSTYSEHVLPRALHEESCFLTHLLVAGGSLLHVAANKPSYSL